MPGGPHGPEALTPVTSLGILAPSGGGCKVSCFQQAFHEQLTCPMPMHSPLPCGTLQHITSVHGCMYSFSYWLYLPTGARRQVTIPCISSLWFFVHIRWIVYCGFSDSSSFSLQRNILIHPPGPEKRGERGLELGRGIRGSFTSASSSRTRIGPTLCSAIYCLLWPSTAFCGHLLTSVAIC
jgi:hypothetical protein